MVIVVISVIIVAMSVLVAIVRVKKERNATVNFQVKYYVCTHLCADPDVDI